MEINVHHAKTHLSKLLAAAEAGEEVIARNGKLAVKLVVAVAPDLALLLAASVPASIYGTYSSLHFIPELGDVIAWKSSSFPALPTRKSSFNDYVWVPL